MILQSKIATPVRGDYHFTIRADFDMTLQPDDIVQNIKNYSFNSPSLIIEGIHPITDKKGSYSHYINITLPKGTQVSQECLTFNVPNVPSWVFESNDENGREVLKNLSKTTGIKYLIQGVADAYKSEQVITKIVFNIKHR